jgi:hypothetical protein
VVSDALLSGGALGLSSLMTSDALRD